MTEPPPPPYQETDPNPQPPPYQETQEYQAPPTYEDQQQTYEQQQNYDNQQQTYDNQQQTYDEPPPTNTYDNQQPTNTYDPPPTGGDENQPEDVVATSGSSSSSKAAWSFGSMEDGDGFFGKRKLRLITMGSLLVLFSFLAFPFWFGTEESIFSGQKLSDVDKTAKTTSFEDGWNLHAAGLFFMFLAFIACLVLVFLDWRDIFPENKFVNLVAAGVMWLGAFLYWVGGMTVAGSYNDIKKNIAPESQTALAGVAFGEATFIFLLGVSLGLDIFINIHSKSKRVRIYLINGIIILTASLILFFAYASMNEKDFNKNTSFYGKDLDLYAAFNTIAAGWFFVLLGIILLGVLEFLLHSNSFVTANSAIVWYGTIGFFLFGAFLTAIGYWAACDREQLTDPPAGIKKKDTLIANGNLNAYYVGMSFVILVFCSIIAIDIKLHEFIPFNKDSSSNNNNNQQTDTDNVVYDPPTTEP